MADGVKEASLISWISVIHFGPFFVVRNGGIGF